MKLASRFQIEIISADAMQVYRGLDIGTAKPTSAERAAVKHHLIDVVDPDQPYSVASYVDMAEAAIADVLARGSTPLVVGGSGFYLRALSEGVPTVPEADPAVQTELWQVFHEEGLRPLLRELEAASPLDASRTERNPRRVVRALEVLRRTGSPPSAFAPKPPSYAFDKVVLMPRPELLEQRIRARTEAMFDSGLVAEVADLMAQYASLPTAVQAIGYKEVMRHLAGMLSLAEAKEAVARATLRYAKRQQTWFRKEPGAALVDSPEEARHRLRAAIWRLRQERRSG